MGWIAVCPGTFVLLSAVLMVLICKHNGPMCRVTITHNSIVIPLLVNCSWHSVVALNGCVDHLSA